MKGLREGKAGERQVVFFQSIENITSENCPFRCQQEMSANVHYGPYWIQREKQVSSNGTSLLCNLYGRNFAWLKLVDIYGLSSLFFRTV